MITKKKDAQKETESDVDGLSHTPYANTFYLRAF
jgi:hypothetical protein